MRTRHTVFALVAAAAASMLVACMGSTSDEPVETVVPETATFSQYASIPDFDSSTFIVDDPAALQELGTLLSENGVVERDYQPDGEAVPGGTVTSLTVTWPSGQTNAVVVGGTDDPTDFEQELTDLVSGWRESGEFESINVP